MKKPYKERIINESVSIRGFSFFVKPKDLAWHRDHENRIITIIEGSGWKFQRENELPFLLNEGDIIKINAKEYHRLLKGKSNLIVKIVKN